MPVQVPVIRCGVSASSMKFTVIVYSSPFLVMVSDPPAAFPASEKSGIIVSPLV